MHALRYDPNFTAAKKVSKEVKANEEKEQNEAALRLFEDVLEVTEVPKGICQLPCCGKFLTEGKDNHWYCSRRHYYKDYNRRGLQEDLWEKAAKVAVATLTTQAMSKVGAQAVRIGPDEVINDERLWWTLLVLVCFSFIGLQYVTYKI